MVGTETSQLLMADVNIGVALTGFRSWNHIVPEVSLGAGFVSDFKDADAGGFKFGAPLALLASGGARWVPGGRWQLRADLTYNLQRYDRRTDGSTVFVRHIPRLRLEYQLARPLFVDGILVGVQEGDGGGGGRGAGPVHRRALPH